MRKIIFFYIFVFTLASCSWDHTFPKLLVEADSLLMRGAYIEADRLLALYDSTSTDNSEACANYRQLLRVGRLFVDEDLSMSDFSLVDSLCRYYEYRGSLDKYAKALCFLGAVYQVSDDYPSAMDFYLKAKDKAESCGDCFLMCWILQCIGNLYFAQHMYEDCVVFYYEYYNLSQSNNDTLRMALSSFDMARVYTIQNNVDSILSYYNKSIELAKHTQNPENIIPAAQRNVCDIYIQTRQYEKAREYLSNDSLCDANWAYWYLGQNQVDSAVVYFEKIQNRYGIYGQAEVYRHLAQLEERRYNVLNSLAYYKKLQTVTDSIKKLSQAVEIKKINAQYNFSKIKRERDSIEKHSKNIEILLYAFLFLFVFLVLLSIYIWKYYKQKHSAEIAQEKLLRHIEEEKYRQSIIQVDKNKRRIAELETLLRDADKRNDTDARTMIELDAEQLRTENMKIEAYHRKQKYLLNEFTNTSLYIRIKKYAGKDDFCLTEEEWDEIGKGIDTVYDNFTQRLFALVSLSDVELKTCYLIKLRISPADIAVMLFKSKAAITMLRQRLYEKITRKKGTAKQLDEFVLNF